MWTRVRKRLGGEMGSGEDRELIAVTSSGIGEERIDSLPHESHVSGKGERGGR